MGARAFVVIALLSLPCAVSGQLRLPRGGRQAPPQAAPLPPEAEPVARALVYKQSRWSAEGYSLLSSLQIPTADGGATRYTTFGTGTHADYRYTEQFSATMDLTVSALGSPSTSETAEVGTRFRPLSWDAPIRPFVDARAGYMHLYDNFATSTPASAGVGRSSQELAREGRYSRGFGGVGGAGLEFSLTRTFALTTEVSAMRNRMTTYRLSNTATIPAGATYWMTSFRYALGLKYNPVSVLHLGQKPTS